MKKVTPKICIAGAVGSGREKLALMLSEITGLKLINWTELEQLREEVLPNLKCIVWDVASDERLNEVREKGFVVIQYRNEACKKAVRLTEEDHDPIFFVKASDRPKNVYDKLVKLFESVLVEVENV